MLLQVHFEYRGVVGLIVAIIGFILLVFGFVRGLIWFWGAVGKPTRDRWRDRKTLKRAIAFNKFRLEWLMDRQSLPVFIMDEKKRCIWVNEALTDTMKVDSSEVEGRGWYHLIKESELTRVLQKWDEAYEHQSPYVNVSIMMVHRKEKRFVVRADPFIWGNKVVNFIGTLEPIEDPMEVKVAE